MNSTDLDKLLRDGLTRRILCGSKVLLIIPDTTRTAPVADMVRRIHLILRDLNAPHDIMVALGTHPPLAESALRHHLGVANGSLTDAFPGVRVMNHAWDDPASLISIGTIPAARIAELSHGLMAENVPLTLNRAIRNYDQLLILGPVFPHEVAGFSGGSKYLFPGISGPEMIDFFHWLGAIITNLKTIGIRDNPVRAVLDEAALQVPLPVHAISMVVHNGQLTHVSVGGVKESWRAAVEQSQRLHVARKPRLYQRVLACAPQMYDDLWTGGKCMYKCEAVVADGGEIIIYAPHITSFSITHGHILEQIGYHVIGYYLRQPERFKGISRAVMAVSSYLKGAGEYRDGGEHPRIRVTLASGINRETCARAGLGYTDPARINLRDWRNREEEGLLFIEKAGETLYLPQEKGNTP